MKKIISNIPTLIASILLIVVIFSASKFQNSINEPDYIIEADSSFATYFPLAIGNSFTYLRTSTFPSYKIKAKMTKDTIIGGKKYYYCLNFPFIGTGWVRFDTATGNLLKRSTMGCSKYPNDLIMDSLRSKINDQIYCIFDAWAYRRCLDTGTTIIFNTNIKAIYFLHDGIFIGNTRYAKNIGLTYNCLGEPPPCSDFYFLKGCVVNGIVYGDTTMTGVKIMSSEIPLQYNLYQNYPNPFNPTTKIKFDILTPHLNKGGQGGVSLKIYDILGKEIATLVNEQLAPGTYSVDFDGSNYSSGIYFYKLLTNDYIETKKMVLIK